MGFRRTRKRGYQRARSQPTLPSEGSSLGKGGTMGLRKKWSEAGAQILQMNNEKRKSCLSRRSSVQSLLEDIDQGKLDQWEPDLCLQMLKIPAMQNYGAIRKLLKQSSETWMQEFLSLGGLGVLFEALENLSDCSLSLSDAVLQIECVGCVRAVMNSKAGLESIVDHPQYLYQLLKGLSTQNTVVKKQVFELLSAVSMYSCQGHQLSLEALQTYQKEKKANHRFSLLIKELRNSEVPDYSASIIAYINCIILGFEEKRDRFRVRQEFISLGFLEVLEKLRNVDAADIQAEVFDKSYFDEQVSLEYSIWSEDIRTLCLEVCDRLENTPHEASVKEIFQTILHLDSRTGVWETIADLLSKFRQKIELYGDSPFYSTHSTQTDLMNGHLHDHISATNRLDRQYSENLNDVTDGAVLSGFMNCFNHQLPQSTPKPINSDSESDSYSDAKSQTPSETSPLSTISTDSKEVNDDLSLYVTASEESEKEMMPSIASENQLKLPRKKRVEAVKNYCFEDLDHFIEATLGPPITEAKENLVTEEPKKPSQAFTNLRQRINDSLTFQPASPVPADDNKADSIYAPPPLPSLIPPPPPPPPPPLQSTWSLNPAIPPPPPLPVRSFILPGPGTGSIPPPPPPPTLSQGRPVCEELVVPKSSLSLASAYTPAKRSNLKTLNWTKVTSDDLNHSVWHEVSQVDLSPLINVKEMQTLFSRKTIDEDTKVHAKKVTEKKEINLLEHRRSLQVNIFLHQFKLHHEQLIEKINTGDTSLFDVEKLRSFLKILPSKEELKLVKSFNGDATKLASAEKFFLGTSTIPCFQLKVECLLKKVEVDPVFTRLESQLDILQTTCTKIKDNKSLKKFLKLLLDMGNVLNEGSYAGSAPGFRLNVLSTLDSIRANKPRVSLLHYVVETAEKDGTLLSFLDEIDLQKSKGISLTFIEEELSELHSDVRRLTKECISADAATKLQYEEFLHNSSSKLEKLSRQVSSSKELSIELCEYFCEDETKFKLEPFLLTINNFFNKVRKVIEENAARIKEEVRRKKRLDEQKSLDESSLGVRLKKSPNIKIREEPVCIVDLILDDIRKGNFKLRRSKASG